MNSGNKHKAIFLDRDGTIIENIPYLKDPSKISLIPGCVEALQQSQTKGYKLVVVTNQSGIGRGLITENDLNRVHAKLSTELQNSGIVIEHFYFCPHLPPELNSHPCECRKPKSKLFRDAIRELGIDANCSFTIGDSLSDMEAGANVGTKTILFDPHSKQKDSTKFISKTIRSWNEVSSLL